MKKRLKKFLILFIAAIMISGYTFKLNLPWQKKVEPIKNDPVVSSDIVVGEYSASLINKYRAQGQIKKVSVEELSEFISTNNLSSYSNNYDFSMKSVSSPQFTLSESSGSLDTGLSFGSNTGLSAGYDSSSNNYSTTNVQVKGVDEADVIKTDGKYIYALSNKSVFIIDAGVDNNLSKEQYQEKSVINEIGILALQPYLLS